MFAFACIAGGLIVACTVFALLVASGPEVTLSDIARQRGIVQHESAIGVEECRDLFLALRKAVAESAKKKK